MQFCPSNNAKHKRSWEKTNCSVFFTFEILILNTVKIGDIWITTLRRFAGESNWLHVFNRYIDWIIAKTSCEKQHTKFPID